ncbi:MAG: hypothetical protein K0B52_05755, partial [FCB group bacterium]|nr:hypothetical protein [FCB group bacterium]
LSFTRGNEMPHNTIRGFVSGLKSGTAATIHISRLVSHPDSVLARPEYLTQSDGEGYFSFEYLPADTFFIAAYLDLNKSNTYDRLSDGVCVPSRPWIVPDTLRDRSVDLLAIHDNLLPPRLLRASSICPDRTQLEFTKDPAPWNAPGVFTIAQGHIDTVLYDQKTCTIFHTPLSGDSLYLWIKGLKDYLACTLKDTSFSVPVNAFKDTLYAFEQKHQTLFITPLPGADRLRGIFKSRTDTLDIELTQKAHGLYAVPYAPVAVRGNWHVSMPFNAFFPGIVVDSTYTVPLQLSAPPEYSAVNGLLEMPVPQDYRLVLENTAGNRYETVSDGHIFSFTDVVAGTYTLSWYRDRNGNKRPDPGRPYPYERPEIVYPLEKGIQVRARWDVELSDPYKIPVENEE